MQSVHWRDCPRKEALRTLNRSIASHILTIVAAPAGYGKTVMARKLTGPKRTDGRPRRRFFHAVPDDIASPREWWEALFAGLAGQGLECAGELRRIGFPSHAAATRRVVEVLDGASDPFLLILDDFHHFADPALDAFMEALVRARPSDHRLAVFSRAVSAPRLGALEREGLAVVHRRELLTFAEADAVRFFFLNGVADREAARRAWWYSEGWATALWLCLLHRKTGGETPPPADIENLLDSAVFAARPDGERDFLLRLSLLESCAAEEAAALSGRADAGALLEALAGGNALIRRDESGERFVFHRLFRDFLARRRADRADLDTPDLHRRAAECRLRRREFLPAFRLLLQAGRDGDLLRILDVIESDGAQGIYDLGRDALLPIIQKIPWRVRVRQPFGYFHCVWLCNGLDAAGSPALFEEMAERFAAAKEIPARARRRLAGEMEQMRGWMHLADDPVGLVQRYARARALLDGPSLIREEQRCWNYGMPHLLGAYLRTGMRYPRLRAMLETAHQSVRVLTGYVTEGTSRIAEVEYRLERGEFEAAESLLDELDQLLDFPRNMTSLILARFLRARLLCARGGAEEADNALAALAGLLRDIRAAGSYEHVRCAELALGHVLAQLGRPEAASRWLREGDIEQSYDEIPASWFAAAAHGRLLLAQGDREGLTAFLSGRPEAFGNPELVFGRIQAATLGAIAAAGKPGGFAEAARLLREAVELSRPGGFILSVAEYGDHILPLLRSLAGGRPPNRHLRTLIDLAEQAARHRRRRERVAGSVFTGHERDIMRLVAKGKSSVAIARKLGRTGPSVKNTLMRLYKRLGVKNRTEAARLFRNAARREREKEIEPPSAPPPEIPDGRMDTFRALLRAGREEDEAKALELFGPSGAGAGGDRMMAFHFREIQGAARVLSWGVRLKRPLAYLAFLWRTFRVFERGTSGVDLDEAEYRLSRTGRGEGLAGEITLVRSLLRAQDAETLWNGYAAAARPLGRPSRLHSRDASWTFGNPHSSFIAVRTPGDFARLAEKTPAAAAALGTLSGGDYASLDAAFRMERHLERGELAEARALLPGLEGRGESDPQTLIVSAFARARILLADGLPTMAVAGLAGIAPRIRALGSFEHEESLDLALAYIHAQLGRPDGVPEWIRSGRTATLPRGAAARCPLATVIYGKALLAAGGHARLRAAARAMPTRFGGFDSLLGRIHAKVLEAVAEKHLRRGDEALARLAEAVELSRPDGLVFVIAEYREHVLSLLRRMRRETPGGHLDQVAAFALRTYRGAAARNAGGNRGGHGNGHGNDHGNDHGDGHGDGQGEAPGRRPLTPREREILGQAARGKANHEIARTLGVSVSRVISALTGIYGKIGVSSRVEASLWYAKECERGTGE